MKFKQRLADLLVQKCHSQAELARFVGVKNNTVSDWINKGTSPKVEHIYRIADFFNVSYDFLMIGKENCPPLPDDEQELLAYYKKLPEIEKVRLISRAETLADVFAEQMKKESEKPAIQMSCYDEQEHIVLHYFDDAASAGSGVDIGDGHYEDLTVGSNTFTKNADIVIRVKGNSMQPQFNDGDLVLVRLTPCVEVGEIGIFRIGNSKGYIKKRGADRLISLNPEYDDIPNTGTEDISAIGRVIGVLNPNWIVK